MNYTNEYTIKLTVFYRPNCDSSVGCDESGNVRPVNVTVKLRPLGKLTISRTVDKEICEWVPQ